LENIGSIIRENRQSNYPGFIMDVKLK